MIIVAEIELRKKRLVADGENIIEGEKEMMFNSQL